MATIRPYLHACFLSLALAACGGGGNSTTPPGGGNPDTPADIQTSVPTPTYAADSLALEEFNRINTIRQRFGLGLLAQNPKLDQAAAHHLAYLNTNYDDYPNLLAGLLPEEIPGKTGYTGTTPAQRCAHAGYAGECRVETIRFNYEGGESATLRPYYAFAALSQGEREIGLGQGGIQKTVFMYQPISAVIQLGRPAGRTPQKQASGFALGTYLWGAFHLHVNEGETLQVDAFQVWNTAGQELTGQLLTHSNDPAGRVPGHAAMWIPDHAPTCGSAYTVHFAGKRNGQPFTRSWTDDACSGQTPDTTPPYNVDRDLISAALDFDLADRQASADIRFAPAEQTGLSLRIGDLDILSVTDGATPLPRDLPYRIIDADGNPATPARRIDIHVGTGDRVLIRYRYNAHTQFDGWSPAGFTFLWPYHCENLFPCERSPADGLTFQLALRNLPAGTLAIHPGSLDHDAPAYQLAWAVGDYRWLELGETAAGTRVRAAHLNGHLGAAQTGTAQLRAILDWYESQLGVYPWGDEAVSVEVDWGGGAHGGMEHHPYWHVSSSAYADPLTQAHEAAHAWFGAGVRIACWEDFVLSEGTVSYLAAAAVGAVMGASQEQAVWDKYVQELAAQASQHDHAAWSLLCADGFDVMTIYDVIPYYSGALFYRAVEQVIGRAALLGVLREFAQTHRYQAAGMEDMIEAIRLKTGFDPTPLVRQYLFRWDSIQFG